MIATEEESAPTMRIGAMVMNEDAQLANMRLLNNSRVEDDEPKGRSSSTSSSTDIKQGGSLMIVNAEVNEAINSRATPVYGRAWNVPVRLGKWKGKVDFLVVDIDDEDVVLGMESLHKVQPFRVSDGMITITSKGSEKGIKLSQLKERDVRVSSLKAWWAPRHRRQEVLVNGRRGNATIDTGATHNFISQGEARRLGLKPIQEGGSMKAVNSAAKPVHGVARNIPTSWGTGAETWISL
uniref:Uncharacterized protein n=1 Tax=Chenopodium quinoa TaxID=63459 RepID=A0A803N6L5_CHEQI